MLAILEQDTESMPLILNDIPAWFEEWEETFSRFRLNSELSRLNRTFDQPVEVSEAFWDVFQTALWADELTEGLVTPTVMDAVIEAGYDRSFNDIPAYQSDAMRPTLIQNHPLSMIVTDPCAHTVNLPHGVRLDFGGLAKGWAAHQTVERLQEYGPCLMNAGGDIALSGPQADGKPWPIGVSNPFQAGTDLEVLHLKRCGVASSGKDRRHWNRNGTPRHHIINPFTGLPAETDLLRVTAVAPTVLEAEAVAKTAFILGRQKGLEWIESRPAFACVMILEDGELILSRKMQEYL